jgi:hypothetical protein
MNTELMGRTETLLAHLICADANAETFSDIKVPKHKLGVAVDAGAALQFPSMRPGKSYTFQNPDPCDGVESDHDRLYTMEPRLLLNSVQDIIGRKAEVAFIRGGYIVWCGYRFIANPPKNIWVGARGASLYEVHYREIFQNGRSTYFKRVAAISKIGDPIPCFILGSKGRDGKWDGTQLVLSASIIEDAHRPNAFTASIKDGAEIVLPVPIGEHKELFALRDAPLTPSGRRKAILHWVASHLRRSKNEVQHKVAQHLRGVRQFTCDGLTVTLSPNEAPVLQTV